MVQKTKIVTKMDDDIWRRFTGSCKMENVRVGIKLSKVLDDYLKDGKYKGGI